MGEASAVGGSMALVQLTSTVDAWLDVARLGDEDERVAAWSAGYEAAHPSIFAVYHSAWGLPERRSQAACAAPRLVERILRAEARATRLLRAAEQDLRSRGLLDADDQAVVLMVGSHSSNGWVAEHQGRRTLFLALEYLGEPPYDDVLVVHELTHVVQAELTPEARAPRLPSAFAVLLEGAAVAATRLLRPGLSDSAYLWMDDAHASWVSDCRDRDAMIARLILDELDSPDDEEAVAPLFRNRETQGIPPRAAYWAGDQVVRSLVDEGLDLRSVLSLGAGESRRAVEQWARRVTQPSR